MKSLKTLLGLSLLALIGVWMGCSNDTSPVASYSASKSHTAAQGDAGTGTPSTGSESGTPSTGSESGATDTSSVVAIPDAALASAIRTALGRPASDSTSAITQTDLKSLTTLTANHQRISDLTGLEEATGLENLVLRWNSVSDLSPLAGLTSLKYLELLGNDISDIRPLAGLTNLERLGIGSNGDIDFSRDDIGVLAGLTKLRHLRVNAMGLQNSELKTLAHGLVDLEDLTILNLSGNGSITDYSPLTCLLPTLKRLDLRGMDNRTPSLWVIDADADEDVTGSDLKVVNEEDWPILQFLVDSGVTIHWS